MEPRVRDLVAKPVHATRVVDPPMAAELLARQAVVLGVMRLPHAAEPPPHGEVDRAHRIARDLRAKDDRGDT